MSEGHKGSGLTVLLSIGALIVAFIMNFHAKDKTQSSNELDKYVKDEVGIIDDATKEQVLQLNKELKKNYDGTELFVAVVQNHGRDTIKLFTKNYFNTHQIGDSDNQNGVLLLMSIDENESYITFGSGFEYTLAGDLAVSEYENFESEFKAKRYNEALQKALPEYGSIIKQHAEKWREKTITKEATPTPKQEKEPKPTKSPDFNIEDYVMPEKAISLVASGIGAIIRAVIKLIAGLFSSVLIGFIVVIIIIRAIVKSAKK